MTFLIDGYNLMHAVGSLRQGIPRGGLEGARNRFLDWLSTTIRNRAVQLRVVFDARGGPRPSPETVHRGVRVFFAYGETADDAIEEILAKERLPARLTVVSNDGRVREAGRRRGAAVYTCQEFVDWTIDDSPTPTPPSPSTPTEKPEPSASSDEMAAWLAAFSHPKRKPR